MCVRVCVALQEFQPSGPTGKTVTIGVFARDIFLDQVCISEVSAASAQPQSQPWWERTPSHGKSLTVLLSFAVHLRCGVAAQLFPPGVPPVRASRLMRPAL